MGLLACARRKRFLYVILLFVGTIAVRRAMMIVEKPAVGEKPVVALGSRELHDTLSKAGRKSSHNSKKGVRGEISPDVVVGIPTIERSHGADYLNATLSSLLSHRRSFEKVVFVVYIAETNRTRVEYVSNKIREEYDKEIAGGLIQIISPPDDFYPDWRKDMKLTLGDPYHQVKWRSKQNLDQAFLMSYVYNLHPKYYLMVEDDVSAADDYLNIIFEHAESSFRENLLIISYCKWGAIGKLFKREMLPTISSYLKVFWNYKPLDWLISDLLHITACRYPLTNCEIEINSIKIDFSRQLFAHNGKISSLLTESPL